MTGTKNYCPLHCHSHYSLLDGLSKPSHIAKRIVDIKSQGCALTDHGVLSGAIDFLSEMDKVNKKPVLGIEQYVCFQNAKIQNSNNRKLLHLPLLCKNNQGWKQLLKITTSSNNPKHFYFKPRLSLEQLAEFLDGNIIGFSGHLGSNIHFSVDEYGIRGGVKTAELLQEMFGKGNFYLEVQLMARKTIPEQIKLTEQIREISNITKIPCIATPDAHYACREDAEDQRILLCSNMHITLDQGNSPDFVLNTFFRGSDFHIPSYSEMVKYGHTEEELDNTNKILDQIDKYDILSPPILKKFDCPNNMSDNDYLTHLCREGWKKLIVPKKLSTDKTQIYIDRIKYELGVLQEAELSSYFLILSDILQFVRNQKWLLGPARGSSAGCLVSYLIGITKIDPIQYDLIFERFYSAARKGSLPDIDIDVPVDHRDKILTYIKNKYGEDHVGQMVTFQTMQGSKALKEVFRAYGDIPFEQINHITKKIYPKAKISDELQKMQEETGDSSVILWNLQNRSKEFYEWCHIDDGDNIVGPYSDRFKQAIRLEGVKSAQSRHPAGIVISPHKISNICPMVYDTKQKNQIAGFEMENAERVGLVKLDVLGISFLDKIMKIVELLQKKKTSFNPDIEYLDLTNEKTWDLISAGNTKGIFQLESQLGQSMSKKLKPENMEHLSALMALLRPGCLTSLLDDGKSITEHYIMRKNIVEEPSCINDSLQHILQPTYQLMIYQEQALKISSDIAGMNLNDADKYIRKGIGKKKADLIAKAKKLFLDGCKKEKKINQKEAKEIFSWIEQSARYSFNKSILGSTNITTDNNIIKTVDELKIDEKIKCPNSNNDIYCTVKNKFEHGIQEVYEIELEKGRTITCTMQHKFLCENGQILPLLDIIYKKYKIMCEDSV